MASKFTFTNSKTVNLEDNDDFSILCNDLEEKNKFIYFRRGPFGEGGSACGNDRNKIRKDNVTWELTGEVCDGGKPIWKITINA